MQDDLLTVVRERKSGMTGAGRTIAEYILANCNEASRMSIAELSEKCGLGASSVHRFCIAVGCENYRDFRRALGESLQRHGIASIPSYECSIPNDPAGEIIVKLCNGLHKYIDEMIRLWDGEKLARTIDALRKAERIALFGMGSSMSAALTAYQRFLSATPKALCPQTYESQLQAARRLLPGDAAILFPEPKLLDHAMELGRICSNNSVFIIGAACMTDTPLASMCDIYLPTACHEQSASVARPSLRCVQDICVEIMCSAYECRYAAEDCLAAYSRLDKA